MTADPMSGLRPAIAAVPESGIVELVNHGRGRPNLIPLWVGEGDRPTPHFICQAAARALEDGHTFYTHQRGIPPLRRALADYLSGLHESVVDPERITVTGAGMQAVMLTVQAIIGPGDEVVMPSPVWPNLKAAIDIMGGVVRSVPLDFSENGWACDLDRLLSACGPRTKALFINTPGNPTGWIMPRADMVRLRDFARTRGLWIIADEVYGRFAYELGTAPSFLSIMEPEERLVVVNSFSKNWAMTGWRMGWTVGPASIGQVMENLVQYNTSGVATFQQHAAVAALRDGEPFVQSLITCAEPAAIWYASGWGRCRGFVWHRRRERSTCFLRLMARTTAGRWPSG